MNEIMEDSYQNLVEDCKSIMSAYLPDMIETTLTLHWFMGKRISEMDKEWKGKEEYYQKLAKDLKISVQTIKKEIAFYKQYPNLAISDTAIDMNVLYKEYSKPTWYKISNKLTDEKLKLEAPKAKSKTEIQANELTELNLSITQIQAYLKKNKVTKIAVITEEGVKEIINIQNAKDELYEVVKEFYGDVKVTDIEWRNAKLLLNNFTKDEIINLIQKLKSNKQAGYYSRNCASLRYLYSYYSEIYKEQNNKELPDKEEFEEYAKLHPEWA